ncbi:MAG TPA: YtxH domain-containing protein [Vicinamibacteria bacterium]|nr:YtxH domain-containing protein [Vicinamibacteria bacterium]
MSDDRGSGGSSFLAFLLGGLTGAAVALLYAPRTGRETREMLNEKLREGGERSKDLREQAREKSRAFMEEAGDYMDRGREVVEDRKGRLAAAFEAGRQAYRDEKEKSKS